MRNSWFSVSWGRRCLLLPSLDCSAKQPQTLHINTLPQAYFALEYIAVRSTLTHYSHCPSISGTLEGRLLPVRRSRAHFIDTSLHSSPQDRKRIVPQPWGIAIMSYNSLKGRFKDMFLDGSEANRLDPEPFPAFDPTYTRTSRKPSPERDTTSINALAEPFPDFDSACTDASRTPSPERNMTNANPLAEPFPEFDPTYTGRSRTPSPERDMTEQFEIETGLRFEKHDNFQHNNFQVDSSAVLPPDDASGSPLLQKISSTTSLFSGDSSVPIYTPDSENAPSSSLPVPLYPIVDGGSDSSKALASPLSTAFGKSKSYRIWDII